MLEIKYPYMHLPIADKTQYYFDHIQPNTVLTKSENIKFTIHSLLGRGSYGQVYRAYTNNKEVAIKIMRPESGYFKHGLNEINILEKLNVSRFRELFVTFFDSFVYKNHLCIVQEVLDKNLYEVLSFTNFAGFEHKTVKTIAEQLLRAIEALHKMNIVHCDLKPENIMLSDVVNIKIKLIDFGNTVANYNQSNFYVQSRYYRAPEVILGLPYNSSVDMWSFGCIIYELFIGHPLFPGINNADQIERINTLFGIPEFMIQNGTKSYKYYGQNENRPEMSKIGNNVDVKTQKVMNRDLFECKIMNKDSSFSESSNLLQLIMYVLKVNHLDRPSSSQCRKHFYFNDNDSVEELSVRKWSRFEIERNQPNPEPFDEINRRASVADSMILERLKQLKRKKSVFENPDTKENKEK